MANTFNNVESRSYGTYTLAQRNKVADVFQPIKGIPQDMTLMQAREMADKARANGFDVVAYNTQAD